MMHGLSRRALLLGSAGVIAACAAGLGLSDEEGLVRATLARMLGPFQIDSADMRFFITDFKNASPMPEGIKADVVRAAQASGTLPLIARLIPPLGRKTEEFRRSLMTAFVLGTDYFEVANPAKDKLSYRGLFTTQACTNPFARFD